MNYLIVTDSSEAKAYAELLFEAIQRYDIRARFFRNAGPNIIEHTEQSDFDDFLRVPSKKELRRNQFDLAILIGENFNRKLLNRIKELNLLNCFFLITSDPYSGQKNFSSASKSFDKVFVDVPIYPINSNSEQVGLYMNDVFRRNTYEGDVESLTIGMLIDDKRNVRKGISFIESYSKVYSECNWLLGGSIDRNQWKRLGTLQNVNVTKDTFHLLKQSNAVIVDNQRNSMEAALLNCPQITVGRHKSFLDSAKKWEPLINQVTKQGLIKNIPFKEKDLLASELNLVLNDHEYCAGILTEYQTFKDKVGSQPVARNIAQKLIEWIEEETG